MAHADMNLPPELLEGYEQTVELRDRNGNIRADARETVIQIVKPMLTLGGKLEESVARRLGGQPSGHHAGRAKLVQPLIDAVRGLVGPLPNLKAWLMAEASGGFDCRSNTGYRSRLKRGSNDERGIGSPGAYLPRQLAQQRDDIAKGRVSHTTSWVQHTEISVMTAALLLQDIQRAAGATLAMGPAFVIMTAVDTLPEAVQRKIDALAGDDEYRARIAKAIDEVTAKFEADSQRSNQQIKTSLPSGVDINAYFEEREATFRKAALDEVMSAIDQMLKPEAGQEVQSDIQRAASLIIAKVRSAAPNGECLDTERRIIYATSYMDRAVKRGGAIATDDVKRLQVLLPHLWQDENDETQCAAALLSANIFSADSDMGTFWFTGEQGTDSVIRGIMKRIARYVMEVGPPPFDVPPEHLPLFGLVASTCVALGATEYQGIKTWQQLGALKGNEIDPAAIDAKILAVRTIGLAGLTV